VPLASYATAHKFVRFLEVVSPGKFLRLFCDLPLCRWIVGRQSGVLGLEYTADGLM